MKKILRHHTISVKNALSGIRWAFTTQPNFTIHMSLSILAIGAGIFLGISSVEMCIIVFAIIIGLGAEMVNTSLESITDLVTKKYHDEAKIAKDVAAGMMLITATGTILIAIFIFFPYIQLIL